MSAAMGRISGNLLANNLTRNGVDLKFSNTGISDTVLYLGGANNRKIGIGSESPLSELYVYNASGSNVNSTNFLVDTLSTFQNNWTVTANTISYPLGTLNIVPSPAAATVTDISSTNSTIVNTGNALYNVSEPSANPDYGSVAFTGTNSLSIVSADALSLGVVAYTVEGWFYYGAVPTGGFLFGKWDDTLGLEYGLRVTSAVQMTWYNKNSSNGNGVTIAFNSPPANAWHHFAAVRSGNTVTVFIDGVSTATATYGGTQKVNSGAPFTIGGRNSNTNNITAYITYVRVVPGKALYTANFTPPLQPTAVSGTTFLLQAKGPTGIVSSTGIQGGDVAIYGPTNTIQSGGAATYPSSTPDQDLNFSPIGTFTATLTNPSGNLITLSQNTNTIVAGYPIIFSGTAFGNIVLGYKYYVYEVVDTSHITITDQIGGGVFTVSSDAGTMTAKVYGVMSLTAPSSTIYGSMHSTGDITLDGNIALGIVSLNGINSSLIPPAWHYVATGSAQFSGSNSLSIATNTAFGFALNDFTLEGWYYHTSGSSNHRLFDFRTTEPNVAPMLGVGSSNQIYYFVNGLNRIIGSTLALNTWTHIALVRASGITKLYVNGTQSGSAYTDVNNYGTTNPLRIGTDYQGSNGYVGSMASVRVVSGTAVYTGSFTPSTVPLTAITNTQLLLLATVDQAITTDSSTNNLAVTNNSSVTYNAITPFTGTNNVITSVQTYQIGNSSTLWRNTYFGTTYGSYNVSNVSVNGSTNTISNTAPNTDLTLKANGTGGLFVVDLRFSQNDIKNIKANPANDAESSITLVPNGTGIFSITGTNAVQLAYGNDYNPFTISAPASVAGNSASWPYNIPTLNGAVGSWSGTGTSIDGVTLYVTSYQKAAAFYSDSGHFIPYTVPVGLANSPGTFSYISKTGRTLSQNGEIRLNSKYNIYEGYQPSGLVSFTNLWDTSRTTYVTPELTPGLADNTLRFTAGGNLIASVDTSKMYVSALATGKVGSFGIPSVTFTDNKLAIGTANVTFSPASGNVNLNTGASSQLVLSGSTIPNTLNTAFSVGATGTGYVKFTGKGGIVIPYGDDSARPVNPEQGTARYSTTATAGEIFSATNGWIPISGISPVLSSDQVYEVMEFWSLVLG
jgi:hypothetical protein